MRDQPVRTRSIGKKPSRRWLTARAVLVVLVMLSVVSAVATLRSAMAQVYFEPTSEALGEAATGRHAEVVWATVLLIAGFVAAVVSERIALLVNALVALFALVSGDVLVVAAGCVLAALVNVAVLVVVLARPGRS